jgi:hypothetical protein
VENHVNPRDCLSPGDAYEYDNFLELYVLTTLTTIDSTRFRTGCPIFTDLWSYVLNGIDGCNITISFEFSATTLIEQSVRPIHLKSGATNVYYRGAQIL